MLELERTLREIYACIDRINEQLPPEERIAKDPGTVLVAADGGLESLTLINLMVEVEEAVATAAGKRVSILEGALMHKDGARFSTVDELARWISERA